MRVYEIDGDKFVEYSEKERTFSFKIINSSLEFECISAQIQTDIRGEHICCESLLHDFVGALEAADVIKYVDNFSFSPRLQRFLTLHKKMLEGEWGAEAQLNREFLGLGTCRVSIKPAKVGIENCAHLYVKNSHRGACKSNLSVFLYINVQRYLDLKEIILSGHQLLSLSFQVKPDLAVNDSGIGFSFLKNSLLSFDYEKLRILSFDKRFAHQFVELKDFDYKTAKLNFASIYETSSSTENCEKSDKLLEKLEEVRIALAELAEAQKLLGKVASRTLLQRLFGA